jgi:hypothetical protein
MKAMTPADYRVATRCRSTQAGRVFPSEIANPDEYDHAEISGNVDASPTNFCQTFSVPRNTSAHQLQKPRVFDADSNELQSNQSPLRD